VVELLVELADERDLGLILISHDAKMVSAIADKLLKL
jgi:ABC-type dipeptide/oligopeptide/nickel transport system ATPase subunit